MMSFLGLGNVSCSPPRRWWECFIIGPLCKNSFLLQWVVDLAAKSRVAVEGGVVEPGSQQNELCFPGIYL